MKRQTLIAVMAAIPMIGIADTPMWLRDVQISPDGQQIAFEYRGDIWTVATAGGEARRLTSNPSYESTPIWSPDSKKIAFASDRHGNNDIFVVDAKGGTPTRLTRNSAGETPEAFTPDGKYVVYSAAIQVPAESAQFPTSRLPQLYRIAINGKEGPTQILGTTAQKISFMGDGKYLYQDVKGFENEWRKHQQNSVTLDIWSYDPATGKHTNLTKREGEDRNPVWDNDGFYFLSERDGGSMNVYRAPLNAPSEAKAVTKMKDHPVRFLSKSNDGLLCYSYDGEIYTQQLNGKPQKVAINITADLTEDPVKMGIPSPSEITVSPDGKSVAFISRGEVFVTSVEYNTTKQITHTPEAEKWVCWGDDSKSLIYTSERDGSYNIYKATMGREDDANLVNATLIKEEALFKNDGHERTVPQLSPDGTQLAFILDRNTLAVKDLESGKVKTLTDRSTYKQRDGAFVYKWSPDSKWIALEVTERDPYTDIAIINVEDGTMTNITQSGYFDENPRWVLDGNAILFASEKYGMRNHASWGSMEDVMIVFLNQAAYDNFKLNKEDAEIAKVDKVSKDDEEKKDENGNIKVEIAGIGERIVRLTPLSSDLLDAFITADGETLYFLNKSDDNNMLWSKDLREGKVEMLKTVPSALKAFETSADGKKVFLLGKSMQQLNTSNQKLTPITYSGTMSVDGQKEREYMFDNIVREERQRFYDKGMHGVDWDKLTKHYRKFLPHIDNRHDYSEMLSEMLGELNVSHTGGRLYAQSVAGADRTAQLGALYDLTYSGNGLKVAEVVEKSPLATADSKVKPGTIIEKINGEAITPENDYSALLLDIAGKKTLLDLYDPTTGERWQEVIKPISAGAMSDLLYQRWVAARAADVERWSGGRLGYVHIEGMNDGSFRTLYSDALGKYNDCEGLVVDIRWNGGGRLHEDIEVFLTGEKYLTQMIRGERSCDMPSRRWNKPSIMVVSEACYSNAHGTPWVYKHKGIGKVVGMPVPGTMTSVNWVTMQDPSMYFGIPVVGYLTAEGNYLENSQLEPDVKIANDPAALVIGEDAQLRTAVETLLNDLK